MGVTVLTIVWLAASRTPDFHVYWQAGAALRTGGWNAVYQITELASFKYHPIFAFLCVPFGLVSESMARTAWACLNGLIVLDMMQRWRTHWRIDPLAIGVGFLCVGHALFWQYAYGNVVFVMLWLWTVALASRSPWRSAACYAVLIALKPFWLALLVPWLICRRFGLIARVAAALAVLSFAPIVFGTARLTNAYQRWFATFADPSQGLNLRAHENQSWYGLLYRHGMNGTELKLCWLAGSALLGALWLWHWRAAIGGRFEGGPVWLHLRRASVGRPNRPVAESAADRWTMELSILPFMLFTAPLSWIHHQVLLWPLLAVAWQLGRASKLARAACIASAILLTGLSESLVGRPLTLVVLEWGIPLLAFVLLNWWASSALSRSQMPIAQENR